MNKRHDNESDILMEAYIQKTPYFERCKIHIQLERALSQSDKRHPNYLIDYGKLTESEQTEINKMINQDFCRKCKFNIRETYNYCPKCGIST